MAKKDFKGGLESLLQNTAPVKEQKQIERLASEQKSSEVRATFIVREDYLEKIKAVAYWERLLVKDVINAAIAQYLEKYGNVKPIPEKPVS